MAFFGFWSQVEGFAGFRAHSGLGYRSVLTSVARKCVGPKARRGEISSRANLASTGQGASELGSEHALGFRFRVYIKGLRRWDERRSELKAPNP